MAYDPVKAHEYYMKHRQLKGTAQKDSPTVRRNYLHTQKKS